MRAPHRDSAQEEWRPVPDYAGLYELSSLGRVRSLYFDPPRLLRPGTDESGYPTIMLSKDGKRKPYTIHRLVCRAFHGPPNALHKEAAHLDGTRTNNRANNLKWVSKRENELHKRVHGTLRFGERSPNARITEEQARTVKRLLARGTGVTRAARGAGVSYPTARSIAEGRNWVRA